MLRSLILSLVVFGALPVALVRPEIGLMVYSWISYMYPQNLTYGFMRGLPIAMIVGATTFAAWLFSKERKAPPATAINVLIIMLAVWLTINQFLFAMNPVGAQTEYIQFIKVLAITVLTTILMQDQRRITLLVGVVVASLGYFALRGGIATILSGGANRLSGPDGSIIAENNALGLALLTVVPLLRYLQLQAKQRILRLALIGGYPFFFLAVFGSYSRGAFVGLAAMLLYLAMKSRRKVGLTIAVVAAFVGAFYLMPQKYTQRLQTTETYQDDGSAEARLAHWYFALHFVVDHPFGGGFKLPNDRVLWKYAPDPTSFMPHLRINVAHSIYFEMMQAQGIPGFVIFVSIILLAFRYGATVARQTRNRPDLTWLRDLSAMTRASLVGYCVGGAFLSLEEYDLFWYLIAFAVICRVVAAREVAKPPPETVDQALPAASAMVPALPVGFLRNQRAAAPLAASAAPRAIADGRQFRRVRGRGAP